MASEFETLTQEALDKLTYDAKAKEASALIELGRKEQIAWLEANEYFL